MRAHRLQWPGNGNRYLLVIITTVTLAMLGLGAIAVACWQIVPPIVHDPAFVAKSTVEEGFFYPAQPAKTAAYQLGALALPFLIALGFWCSRRWVESLDDQSVDRLNVGGIVAHLALMISCALPIVYCPHPPFWIMPPSWLILPFDYSHPFYSPARLLVLAAAAGFEFYLLTHAPSRRNGMRATFVLLAVWLLLIPGRVYLPSEIGEQPRFLYHLNAVLDALSQSVNGHHVLVDFPHIYGGYVEVLAPLLRLFPRDPRTLFILLALTDIVGRLCLLFTAALLIRRPAELFLCGLALIGAGCAGSLVDINFSFVTARLFLPPFGLLAATLYFRRPGKLRYFVTTAIAVLASIWNLDTGIALALGWIGALSATALAARDFRSLARHVAIQAASFAIGWAGFLVYLRLASGEWPDLRLLFYFQRFVVETGYFCLPLLFPDMWIFILSIYVIGLTLVLATYVRGTSNWTTPVALMLSLYGIALFSYFMGRSAPSNLLAVSYPAILLAGMFCSKSEVLMQRRKLPANARFFILPYRIALFWWTFLMVAALPDIARQSAHVLHHWSDSQETLFRSNANFALANAQPHEDGIYFLSDHSGLFYYLTGTTRSIRIPGNIELMQARDMDALVDAIREKRIRKLFVEENFFTIQMYRPDVCDRVHAAIAANYRVEKTASTGQLKLYTPQ